VHWRGRAWALASDPVHNASQGFGAASPVHPVSSLYVCACLCDNTAECFAINTVDLVLYACAQKLPKTGTLLRIPKNSHNSGIHLDAAKDKSLDPVLVPRGLFGLPVFEPGLKQDSSRTQAGPSLCLPLAVGLFPAAFLVPEPALGTLGCARWLSTAASASIVFTALLMATLYPPNHSPQLFPSVSLVTSMLLVFLLGLGVLFVGLADADDGPGVGWLDEVVRPARRCSRKERATFCAAETPD
jgi:hypothetical protein